MTADTPGLTPGAADTPGLTPGAATHTPRLTAVAGPGAAADTAGLTVVAGQPAAEDLAALAGALTAVLARAAAGRAAVARPAGRRAGGWADRARLLRPPLVPGPGAWRRSARP